MSEKSDKTTHSKSKCRLKLYSYFRSSCAWRVRIALEYKGIPYDIIPVQLMKEEQGSINRFVDEGKDPQCLTMDLPSKNATCRDDFKKLNLMSQVPVLIIDDKYVLLQSIAIIEYLDEVWPQKPLLPKDPLMRAKVREISELIASGIQPLQNLSTLHKHSDIPDEKLKWAQFWIWKGLTALEKILSDCAGIYCVGNAITIADCCFIPQVANAHRFKVSISSFPVITRLEMTLSKIPEFERAHASKQPDCPPEIYSKL